MKRIVILALILVSGCGGAASLYPPAYEPEETLELFRLRDGFRIELFAAEPHVQDPVELVFDEMGRPIVVEMPDYPYKPAPGEGRSRIKVLQDTDGDGRVDQHTVFADRLSEATSVLPWKGGLIVTSAPSIYFMKDTNRDGRVDDHVLFSGFFENNSEAQITNLRFNVDNWIYASNFGQPGMVISTVRPNAPPLDVQGGDFRFRLDRQRYELAAGPTQFGQAVDDWGHRFATHNTRHISQLVIPWRYLHRHRDLENSESIVNISDHDLRMYQLSATPFWREERTRRRQKRYDEAGYGQVEYARDHFTGSSGGTVYDGDLFGEAFYGNVFTGDVAGNLVHRDVLVEREDSPVFEAQRAPGERGREFLATTDNWFRPANLTVGPDGALYVIDMYRQHIETPLSIPDDLKAEMDFYAGEDRGRIYRIVPENTTVPAQSELMPGGASIDELVAMLERPGGWWRRTAHRLLVEKADSVAEPALRRLLLSSEMPQARLHALYVLESQRALGEADIRRALADAHPGVRVHAIRLAESCDACLSDVVQMEDDPDADVAMQVLLSLGQQETDEALHSMAQIATRFAGDPWMRKALLSSRSGSSVEMVRVLADMDFFSGDLSAHQTLLQELAAVIGRRNERDEISEFVAFITDPEALQTESWLEAAFTGLSRGLKSREASPNLTPEAVERLEVWKEGKPEGVVDLILSIEY